MGKIIRALRGKYYEVRMNWCQRKVEKSHDAREIAYWIEEMLEWNVKLLAN